MVKKLKGKQWYEIVAPKFFNRKVIGETLAGDPKTLNDRKIGIPLTNLTDDLSKYYIKLFFKIKEIKENKAYTEFDSIECMRDYIVRMVKHRVERLDTIQDLETKDKTKIRIKCITIVNRRVSQSVGKAISDYIKEEIEKQVTTNELDNLLKKIITDEIKNKIIKSTSKIYPIRYFEIRKIQKLNK